MATQQYQLTVDQLTTLMTIDFSTCVGFTPTGTTFLRWTAYRNGSNSVFYDGNEYKYVGFEAQGFRSELNGKVPSPSITFDKASLFNRSSYMALWDQYIAQTGEDYFDWRGAKVQIFRTINLDTAQQLNMQEYVVSQVNKVTSSTIEVQLSIGLGIDRLSSQSIQALSTNRCSRKYRTWNGSSFDYTNEDAGGCPYGNPTTVSNWTAVPSFGLKYYTNMDAALADANKNLDKCSYSVKGCSLRFDPANNGLALPFKGLYAATKTGQ
jgi:phage-related protein